MRPRPFPALWREAFRTGYLAARQNFRTMLAILGVMALIVALYYTSPLAAAAMGRFAEWQHSGGALAAGFASAFAGGLLSETSLVYVQQGGRWNRSHVENMILRTALFFVSGAVVFEFYEQQGRWFGQGTVWSVILPKILVDQFAFSVVWSIPVQTITTRWQALHYSGRLLRQELNFQFVTERMFPVLVTNWYFWLPGVTLVYSMPQNLQMPLCILANAIWALLLTSTVRQPDRLVTGTVEDLVPPEHVILPVAE